MISGVPKSHSITHQGLQYTFTLGCPPPGVTVHIHVGASMMMIRMQRSADSKVHGYCTNRIDSRVRADRVQPRGF